MLNWNNLDTLSAYKELKVKKKTDLKAVMSGESGAERVKTYCVPMAEGLAYNYAAKAVDDDILASLKKLAEEAQLSEKFETLYDGAVVNTGEKRLVLHQLCRGQLGKNVVADGVDKRDFYVEQQNRIAEFANKVHEGKITNAAGEKFTTVVQIGIGGSDLGPRAMYIALENWAGQHGLLKMEARFISNVDPDDASAVLNSIDVAHSLFILVSKSGTWQKVILTWMPSIWTTTSADATLPLPLSAERSFHSPSDRKSLRSFLREPMRRMFWRRKRIR